MSATRSTVCGILLLSGILLQGCTSEEASQTQVATMGEEPTAQAQVAEAVVAEQINEVISESGGLPAIEFCETPDPEVPVSAFNIFRSPISESGDYWVRYDNQISVVASPVDLRRLARLWSSGLLGR